jgi:hypothetical protein
VAVIGRHSEAMKFCGMPRSPSSTRTARIHASPATTHNHRSHWHAHWTSGHRAYAPRMARPLRLALQLVLFFLLLAVVIAIAAPETGPLEKGALLLIAAGLVWLAWRLRQLTTRPA